MRHDLPLPIPPNIAALPVSKRGYPVPWFVEWIDGEPEFRVMDERKWKLAAKDDLCWICGNPNDRPAPSARAYVIGPMCAVNKVSSEPPSHVECAIWAAKACPFLSKPQMVRREAGMPDGVKGMAGVPIMRNPGVALVWITESPLTPYHGLFHIGEPMKCLWFCEGREATRQEVMRSIETGLPALAKLAIQEGPSAKLALRRQVADALTLVPA